MSVIRITEKNVSGLFLIILLLVIFPFSHIFPGELYQNSEEAIQAALKAKQYLAVLFYDKNNEAAKKMEATVTEFIKTASPASLFYKVLTTDSRENETVRKYGINRAPLPLLLIFAPNGALTGGFPKQVQADDLKTGFSVNRLEMEVMKPLQDGKIALVLFQNNKTKFNKESDKAAAEFQNDSRLKGYVEIVRADPDNPKNREFMSQCRLESKQTEATIVLIAPPGQIGGVYKGKTSKEALMGGLAACSGGSCGSSGCSDIRFKKDVSPIVTPLDKVSKLNGVTFTWDRENFPLRLFPEGRKIGLIAQEVESVIPEVVNTDNDGYKSVEYDKLTAVLIEAVKEMKQWIQKQETVIKEQERRIRELENR